MPIFESVLVTSFFGTLLSVSTLDHVVPAALVVELRSVSRIFEFGTWRVSALRKIAIMGVVLQVFRVSTRPTGLLVRTWVSVRLTVGLFQSFEVFTFFGVFAARVFGLAIERL